MNNRISADQLILGAYILQPYAQTEQHIKELAECGIKLIVCFAPKSREVLDLLSKYGVSCILTGVFPAWWGGNGSKSGQMHKINDFSLYQKALEEYCDHPAVWGIDIGDEPSALDFEYLDRVARLTKGAGYGLLPYLNLYPNYAAVSQNTDGEVLNQLGTDTYEEHIAEYVQKVDLPYISYDYYLYPQTKNHNVGKMLDNFRIVADACRRSGKAFWYIPQVNDRRAEAAPPTLNMLRYQAYHALAFGATVINWACYTAGWWCHNVLDENGNKTEQYEKLKSMNRELRAIAEEYMRYKNVDTHLVGFESEDWSASFAHLHPKRVLSCGFAKDLTADGGSLVVGEMVHKENADRHALLACNASDPCDEAASVAKVTFVSHSRRVQIHSGAEKVTLERTGDTYSFLLAANHGVMITFE
jgi:hypothetical protein